METKIKPAVAVNSIVCVVVGMLKGQRGIVLSINGRKASVQFALRSIVDMDLHILEVAK